MSEVLSELDCRRPDFIGGVPVKMIDGQEWFLAEPRIRLVPTDGEIGFEVCLSLDDDGLFNSLSSKYSEIAILAPHEFSPRAIEYTSIQMRLARMMLERNYSIDLDQVRSILQFSTDPEDSVAYAIREAVALTLSGQSPKPLAAGDESSPTPAA